MNFTLPDSRNIDELIADQELCKELLSKDITNQCLRRVYCRTNLAMVEGGLNYLKSYTYDFNEGALRPFVNILSVARVKLRHPIFSDLVPREEATLLLDSVPEVGANGAAHMRLRFLDFKKNFKWTFNMIDRVFKVHASPVYSSIGDWSLLLRAVEVRNRISHPKQGVSLEISDGDLEATGKGSQWFLNVASSAYTLITDSMVKGQAELKNPAPEVFMEAMKSGLDFAKVFGLTGGSPQG